MITFIVDSGGEELTSLVAEMKNVSASLTRQTGVFVTLKTEFNGCEILVDSESNIRDVIRDYKEEQEEAESDDVTMTLISTNTDGSSSASITYESPNTSYELNHYSQHYITNRVSVETFTYCTGNLPQFDDMKRVNCTLAGEKGHENCGWNYTKNLPAYSVPTSISDRMPRPPIRLVTESIGSLFKFDLLWNKLCRLIIKKN